MILQPLIVTFALGLAADKELEKLQGAWQVEKLVGRGKEITGENARRISFEFEGNSLKRLVNGVDRKDPATIKIDASQKPAQIDLMPAKQGDPTMLGIYAIDDDTLKWCFSSKKRPEKFESPEGSDATLIILKRVKK
jgi:uncharacterized protein (TIGR03067 family)